MVLNILEINQKRSVVSAAKSCGITAHDFERAGDGILITSGFGLGLALMDEISSLRYFFDVDDYRGREIPWETLGVCLSFSGAKAVVFSGWFNASSPEIFFLIQKSMHLPYITNINGEVQLGFFIKQAQTLLQ